MKKTLCGIVSLFLMGMAWAGKPNVLLILADDLGVGGLHCYGTEFLETPNLDRLRRDGMKFTNGLAAYPTCKPSRAAFLTGQYGPRTGVYRVKNSYGQEEKAKFVIPGNGMVGPETFTLGQAFKKAGYATAMYGKWHVSNDAKTHPNPHYGFDEAFVSAGAHYNAVSRPPVDLPKGMMIEELFSHKAMVFMEKAVEEEKPFFIYMPYFLVHGPQEAKEDYVAHFRKKIEEAGLSSDESKKLDVTAAMTKMLDEYCGLLIDKVTELGVEEETIIVFTSDNGSYDANLTGGCRGTKGDTYEGGLRVPYLFKWTGKIAPGSECAERIIGVDMVPTLLGLAGIDAPEGHALDGVDLRPLLTGAKNRFPDRELFCFYPKYVRFNERTKRWAHSWRNVIYSGDFKLIEYPENGEYEMFDLATDPKEEKDLAKSHPEKRATLTKALHAWLEEIKAPALVPNPEYQPEIKPGMTEYRMSVGIRDGIQPGVVIRWTNAESGLWWQEYAEVWRKGMKFGKGKRFVAEKLTGCDHDGKKKVGEVAELVVLDTVTKTRRTFRSDDPKFTLWRGSSEEWLKAWEGKEERKDGEIDE